MNQNTNIKAHFLRVYHTSRSHKMWKTWIAGEGYHARCEYGPTQINVNGRKYYYRIPYNSL